MKLKVGDKVSWNPDSWRLNGSWRDVIITGIQSNYSNGSKDGIEVDEIDWVHVVEQNVIVDFTHYVGHNATKHWAWAYQIKQKENNNE